MPDEVPPNISQVFKDVIPFTLSVVSLYALDLLARHFVGSSVAESIGKFFAPLFSAADGYLGITIILVHLHSSGLLVSMVHLLLNLLSQQLPMPMPKST